MQCWRKNIGNALYEFEDHIPNEASWEVLAALLRDTAASHVELNALNIGNSLYGLDKSYLQRGFS